MKPVKGFLYKIARSDAIPIRLLRSFGSGIPGETLFIVNSYSECHRVNTISITPVSMYSNSFSVDIPMAVFTASFKVLPHLKGYSSAIEYANTFKEGDTIECVVDSSRLGKFYKVGEVFTVVKRRRSTKHNFINIKGRAAFTAINFIKTNKQSENNMHTMPTTKFYCVAQENANSKRKYFDGQGDPKKALEEAQDYATHLVGKDGGKVAIMESKMIIKPKVDVDIQRFDGE
jgi:hypothetical protein